MLSPADRIVEATMCCTLRPKGNDREKVIAAALEFVILEYSYTDWDTRYKNGVIVQSLPLMNSPARIDVKDLQELIDELKSTVTLEEPAQRHTTDPQDAL
jgi:hypothetical protein